MTATGVSMADRLREWHDFYILIGTASATLIGLMFVAASVAISYLDDEHEGPMRAFLTPTVLHFTAILVTCLMGTAASQTPTSFGTLVAVGGVVGKGFAARVWLNMYRRGITRRLDLADRFCYVIVPILTYLMMTGTGIVLCVRPNLGLYLLAAALVILLILGIRNAWDMTLWIVVRTPNR